MASNLSALHFHNEEAAFAYVEAHLWPEGPTCPHCGNADAARIGRLANQRTKSSKINPEGKPVFGLWKCYACRKQLTVRIGTIFEDSHAPLHIWLQAIYMMCASKKGISTRQLQRTLCVGMKTAWFLGMRIREAMKARGSIFPTMGGSGVSVEADETYIGRKSTTKRNKPLDVHRIVLSLVEREGGVRSVHIANCRADTLRPILLSTIAKGSRLVTDEAYVYGEMGWKIGGHATVQHGNHEYVRGDVHTNTVEGYFSILKRGMYGVFQHVAPVHLQRYLTEFDFRYTYRTKLGYDDVQRATIALQGVKGRRLTYQTPRAGKSGLARPQA
jgi:transposase-like protein